VIGVPEVLPAECDARAPQSNRSNPPQGAQLHSKDHGEAIARLRHLLEDKPMLGIIREGR